MMIFSFTTAGPGLMVLESLLSSVVFSQVYRLTLATTPGLIFLVMAAIYTLLALTFLGILLLLLRHETRYGLLDKTDKMIPKSTD